MLVFKVMARLSCKNSQWTRPEASHDGFKATEPALCIRVFDQGLFLDLSSISAKSIGSKGQNHAIARGPPESAEGRSRGEGEGECFAPFCLKIINFYVKMLFFFLDMGSG